LAVTIPVHAEAVKNLKIVTDKHHNL